MPDRTRTKARLATNRTRRKKGRGATLKLLRTGPGGGYQQLGPTLVAGWEEVEHDFRATGGKVFFDIVIYDVDGSLAPHLRVCTAVELRGLVFKKTDMRPPNGLTRKWTLEIQGTGESRPIS